jgi:NAD-dependent deacetylase
VQAGSRGVVELHGRITRTRCSDVLCSFDPIEDDFSHPREVPSCPICGANLRADIVMFGEQLPADTHRATVALRDVDLFLAIGTSGTVYPAAGFAGSASHVGARTVFINMEEMDPPNPHFDESYIGPAEEIVPELLVP